MLKAEPSDPLAEAAGGDFSESLVTDAQQAARVAWATAQQLLLDGFQAIRAQAKAYSDDPGRTLDEAQRFVVTRVTERPVTATLAGLGVGFVLGLLLSGRGK